MPYTASSVYIGIMDLFSKYVMMIAVGILPLR